MNLSIINNGRIVYYFLLGIVIPSLLMGYLALRGIRNDQALVEKEQFKKYSQISTKIIQTIDENLNVVQQSFSKMLSSLSKQSIFRIPPDLKMTCPMIDAVFIFKRSREIEFPAQSLLYRKRGGRRRSIFASSLTSFSSIIEMAHRHEFVQNSYDNALALYREAFKNTSDTRLKAEILCAISRVEKKASQWKSAIHSYERLASEYAHVPVANGLPAKSVAQLELGSLFLRIGDNVRGFETLLALFHELLNGSWEIEKSQFEFLCTITKRAIHQILEDESALEKRFYQAQIDSLLSVENEKRDYTLRMIAFQEKAEPFLADRITRHMFASQNKSYRFTLQVSGREVYPMILMNMQGTKDKIWGFLIDTQVFKYSFLYKILSQYLELTQIMWSITDGSGRITMKSENLISKKRIVKSSFKGNFPPWFLELYGEENRLLKTVFFSKRSPYFYMFLLIGCVLGFGVVFTFRTLHHELELNRIKSDFVTAISHEFKSPLTSIRQLSEMLQSGRVISEYRRMHYYNVLVEQSERLKLMINNILDISTMEKGKKVFSFEMINIGKLLKKVVTQMQNQVLHKELEIHAKISTDLPYIRGDRLAIEQAIANLIDNALKFSDKKKCVEVSAFYEDEELVISVQDWGLGISRGEMNSIFRQFYRGESSSIRRVKGSGLGLTLVKEIVEAHSGTIHVQSELGRGSLFIIRIPIKDK